MAALPRPHTGDVDPRPGADGCGAGRMVRIAGADGAALHEALAHP
ncbi:MAG TPA: hypothetical protein PKE32_06370 [Miltoncostaeaceae bacterium]|nr:hypothetical protein [Miltoncostaeaceae bacterium]